eukprot:5199998-Amphidinium_carterae.1
MTSAHLVASPAIGERHRLRASHCLDPNHDERLRMLCATVSQLQKQYNNSQKNSMVYGCDGNAYN